MSQLALFEPPTPDWDWEDAVPPPSDDREEQLLHLGLRYYQRKAVQACFEAWTRPEGADRSTLVVMATGLGKTQVFAAIAALWDKSVNGSARVLVLCHRSELVDQARARLEQMTGEYVEVEQADFRASTKTRIVVASIDTIKQKRRLEKFGEAHFGLVIVDEAHHYLAPTYRKPLDYFKEAKLLGVTATPDRGDAKALGQLFDSVAYVHDILDGIEAGYLAQVVARQRILEGLDLDAVDVQKGDLVASQLDDAMIGHVEGVVQTAIELAPDRQTILFFPGVKTAELAAERLNVLRPGKAGFISGKTPDEERREIVREFKRGSIQWLTNCMVATEGFDAPACSCIVVARPTQKRGLYAQMAGRGTRVLPGLVEGFDGEENAEFRRDLVANSAKPNCLLIDVVGVGTKCSLMGPADLLGGKYTEDEVKHAKVLAEKTQDPGRNVTEYLEQARRELRALALTMKTRASLGAVHEFDPFAIFNLPIQDEERYSTFAAPATAAQLDLLRRKGVEDRDLTGLSKRAANKLVAACNKRQDKGLCTFKQLRQLRKQGVTETDIPFSVAGRAMDYIATHGWGKGPGFDPRKLQAIIKEGTTK